MAIFHLVILASWLTLIVYWVFSAGRVKPSLGGRWRWRWEIGLRLVVFLALFVAFHFVGARRIRQYAVNTSLIAGCCGAVVCACGVGLAVWARACLGRNWGIPMSERAHPEVVTRGPYATIRHPIYAGFLLAFLGSAIGQSVLWGIPLVIAGPYFVYSARREEAVMVERFPAEYGAYRGRTRMLIPFLF